MVKKNKRPAIKEDPFLVNVRVFLETITHNNLEDMRKGLASQNFSATTLERFDFFFKTLKNEKRLNAAIQSLAGLKEDKQPDTQYLNIRTEFSEKLVGNNNLQENLLLVFDYYMFGSAHIRREEALQLRQRSKQEPKHNTRTDFDNGLISRIRQDVQKSTILHIRNFSELAAKVAELSRTARTAESNQKRLAVLSEITTILPTIYKDMPESHSSQFTEQTRAILLGAGLGSSEVADIITQCRRSANND